MLTTTQFLPATAVWTGRVGGSESPFEGLPSKAVTLKSASETDSCQGWDLVSSCTVAEEPVCGLC